MDKIIDKPGINFVIDDPEILERLGDDNHQVLLYFELLINVPINTEDNTKQRYSISYNQVLYHQKYNDDDQQSLDNVPNLDFDTFAPKF